jgi:hypothetical protein
MPRPHIRLLLRPAFLGSSSLGLPHSRRVGDSGQVNRHLGHGTVVRSSRHHFQPKHRQGGGLISGGCIGCATRQPLFQGDALKLRQLLRQAPPTIPAVCQDNSDGSIHSGLGARHFGQHPTERRRLRREEDSAQVRDASGSALSWTHHFQPNIRML